MQLVQGDLQMQIILVVTCSWSTYDYWNEDARAHQVIIQVPLNHVNYGYILEWLAYFEHVV